MDKRGEQELDCRSTTNHHTSQHNVNREQDPHRKEISNRPRQRPKNSDHNLDQNAARKTSGPIVGPPVLRARSGTGKWALFLGLFQWAPWQKRPLPHVGETERTCHSNISCTTWTSTYIGLRTKMSRPQIEGFLKLKPEWCLQSHFLSA